MYACGNGLPRIGSQLWKHTNCIHHLVATEIPLSYISVVRIVLGYYALGFTEYATDIVFLRCAGWVPVSAGYARCVCLALLHNKSINFFIVLVHHRGRTVMRPVEKKDNSEMEGVRSLKLHEASIKVGKKSEGETSNLPGKQLGT